MRHYVKKHFSKPKNHSLIETQDRTTSRSEKIVYTAISLFRFEVKKPSERIALPVKKTLRKPVLLFEFKNRDKANDSQLLLCGLKKLACRHFPTKDEQSGGHKRT